MNCYSIRCRAKGNPAAKANTVKVVMANSFSDAIINSDHRQHGLTWSTITRLDTQETFTLASIRAGVELPESR